METRSSSAASKRTESPLTEPELAEVQKSLREKEARLREESRSVQSERETVRREREQLREEREQARRQQEAAAREREAQNQNAEVVQNLMRELQNLREEYATFKTRIARTETFSNLQSRNEATPNRQITSEYPVPNDTPQSVTIPGCDDGFPRTQCHIGPPSNRIPVDAHRVGAPSDTSRGAQSNIGSLNQPDTILLRDAIESVPNFDGSKPTVYQFIRACRRAQEMIPQYLEPLLTRQILNKLRDRAYLVVEEAGCTNITKLCDKLRNAFGERLTNWEARGELARIYQLPDEHMLDYIARTKDLRETIRDCERMLTGDLTPSMRIEIDEFTLKCFKRGIMPQLRDKTRLALSIDPADTFETAVALYREHLVDRERYNKSKKSKPPDKKGQNSTSESQSAKCEHCNKRGHTADKCWSKHGKPGTSNTGSGENAGSSGSDRQENDKFCKYCKSRGHELAACKKRQYNEAKKRENQPSGNEQGLQVPGANPQKPAANAPNQVFQAQASELFD